MPSDLDFLSQIPDARDEQAGIFGPTTSDVDFLAGLPDEGPGGFLQHKKTGEDVGSVLSVGGKSAEVVAPMVFDKFKDQIPEEHHVKAQNALAYSNVSGRFTTPFAGFFTQFAVGTFFLILADSPYSEPVDYA